MRVSKRWYSVVRHTPSFWSQICCEDLSLRLDLAVARSKPLPLDVSVKVTAYNHRNPLARQRRFLKDICKQLHRWRTADIDLEYELDFLPFLTAPAPLLETARVQVTTSAMRRGATSGFVNLFKGRASRLHTLYLGAVAIPWSSKILLGLKDLTLCRIYNHGPSVDEILNILLACPELHSFRLDLVKAIASEMPDRLPIVELPSLKKLTIESTSAPVSQQLLTHIRPDPHRHFTYAFHFPSTPTSDIDPVSLIRCALEHLPDSTTEGGLEMLADNNFFHLYLVTPTGSYTLRFYGAPPVRVLEYLGPIIDHRLLSLPTKFKLELNGSGDDAEAYLNALSAFRITDLTVTHSWQYHPDLKPLLDGLGTPTVVNGVREWRFPELRRVDIKMPKNNRPDFQKMIEGRYGVVLGPTEVDTRDGDEPLATADRDRLPVPLEQLCISELGRGYEPVDPDSLQAVSVLVGADKVSWY